MPGIGEQVRSFFQRVAEYVRHGSQVAGQWLDEQAAINQRVRAIRRLRAEQKKVLLVIGSKVYTLHTRGKVRNKDVLTECQKVDEILAHIARLKQEIEEIKKRSTKPEIQLMEVEDEEPLVDAEEETSEQASTEQPEQTAAGAGTSRGKEPEEAEEGREEAQVEGAEQGEQRAECGPEKEQPGQ